MSKDYSFFIKTLMIFVYCLVVFSPVCAQEDMDETYPLYGKFKQAMKAPCGQRDEAIRTGRELIEKYGDDVSNSEVIKYIRKKVAEFEEEDPICQRNERYHRSYREKNWNEFFTVSKKIIADERDAPLALDVMLTLVSVGYDRRAVDKDETFNNDTIYFAKLAIQTIESGQLPKMKKPVMVNGISEFQYGVFNPFGSKENALGWMNYVIGDLTFSNVNQGEAAVGYLYQAAQFDSEVKTIPELYEAIGEYYFRMAANENFNGRDEKAVNKILMTIADRALDAYGRAHQLAHRGQEMKYYRMLENLYRFRFNLAPNVKLRAVEPYVKELISLPMPDPRIPVDPVLRDLYEQRKKPD